MPQRTSFAALGLATGLLEALKAEGCETAFPVQERAVPVVLSGRDAVVLSGTGSGKTAAFVAPMLQRLFTDGQTQANAARALVLVPTRELAAQVGDVAARFGLYMPGRLRTRVAFGGVSINVQMLSLRGGADILVSTPGRLLDLVKRNAVRLHAVRTLVLDEADRMLDMGFRDELSGILALLPAARQTLLFSATWDDSVEALATAFLRDPVRIDTLAVLPSAVGASAGAELESLHMEECVYLVPRDDKGPLLRRLLGENAWGKVLVFASSIRKADNVARKLGNKGINAAVLHGDKSQGARTKALTDFREGKVRVLVATDLASRGLDIEGLSCVINYELPRAALDYVHRTGRTSRAGQAGTVLSLVCPDEEAGLASVEKHLGRRLARLKA